GVTSNHGAKTGRLPSVPPNASSAPPTKSSAQATPVSEARPKKAAGQPPVGQARLPPPHGQTRKGDLVSIDRSVLTFLDRKKILGKRRAGVRFTSSPPLKRGSPVCRPVKKSWQAKCSWPLAMSRLDCSS